MSESSRLSRFKPALRKLGLGLGVALSVLLVIELLFRGGAACFSPLSVEKIRNYQDMAAPGMDPTIQVEPHPYMVYTFAPDGQDVNTWGFYFDEDTSLKKPQRTTRILALGGSTTAGPTSWPYHLGELLRDKYRGQSFEVLNFGTGGWTSAESMVAYVTLGQSFEPDIVIVHHAVNDLDPLMRAGFRPDYAHFRKPIALERDELGRLKVKNELGFLMDSAFTRISWLYTWGRIQVSGEEPSKYTLHNLSIHRADEGLVPPEEVAVNADVFKRNLRTIGVLTESLGGEVLLTTLPFRKSMGEEGPAGGHNPWAPMIADQNERVVELAREQGWAVAELHDSMGGMDEAHYEDQVHLDQQGERMKAEHIARALRDAGILSGR